MRTALILAFASALAATSVACAVETADDTSAGLSHKPKTSKSKSSKTVEEGEVDDTDGQPSIGVNVQDPTNPESTSVPTAPTTTGTAAPGFALSLDNKTPTVDLAADAKLAVTITPTNGFNDTVNISVDGLPEGVTASPASGKPGSPITITLTTDATTPVTPKDAPVALTIKGVSGSQTATTPANFKVNPKITMTIPTNTDALLKAGGNHNVAGWGSQAFAAGTPLQTQADNPINIYVRNDDSTPRTVHGNAGFTHGSAEVDPGELEKNGNNVRVRQAKPGLSTSGYLHGVGNGTAVGFKLNVQATN